MMMAADFYKKATHKLVPHYDMISALIFLEIVLKNSLMQGEYDKETNLKITVFNSLTEIIFWIILI